MSSFISSFDIGYPTQIRNVLVAIGWRFYYRGQTTERDDRLKI